MRCIIAGSRTATRQDVDDALRACPFTAEVTMVISGTARGADTHGEQIARDGGLGVIRMPADWATLGRRAGHFRNIQMAKNADALIAVWDGESRGTAHMIATAKRYGLRLFVFAITPLETPDAP